MLIFLVIFSVVSIIHITFISLKMETPRRVSKVLIIPPLLMAYLMGTGSPVFFVIPALVLGWLGDILLIKTNRRDYFKFGLASFLLGHICYLLCFIECLGFFGSGGGSFNFMALVIYLPLALIAGVLIFRFIKPAKGMVLPVIFYTIAIEAMTFGGLQVFIINPGLAGALIFAGCLCFMFSDTILSYKKFRKTKFLGANTVMVSYILAQAGIILGLMRL